VLCENSHRRLHPMNVIRGRFFSARDAAPQPTISVSIITPHHHDPLPGQWESPRVMSSTAVVT
jgi:hypothetical protein